MKAHYLLVIAAAIGALLLLAAGVSLWSRELLRELAYDGVQPFRVGGYRVTIETQSYTFAGSDEGPARIIVSTSDGNTELDSSFNNDLYMDVKPAYISWREVDDARGLDLLIWRPYTDGFIASAFVSSGDGRLHTLEPPLTKDTLTPKLFARSYK